MVTTSKIVAQKREWKGKQLVRKERNAGSLPGVLSLNDGSAREIALDRHSFNLSLRGHGLEGRLLDMEVDGEQLGKYVLKDVQYHPVSGETLHVDFVQIAMGRKMRSITQLVLEGVPAGVEVGGIMDILIRDVEIECLPKDLIDSITIDVSGLKIGDSIHVSDLQVDSEKIQIVTADDVMVVSVSAPRVSAKDEEGAGSAEGEAAAESGAENAESGDGEDNSGGD